MGNLPVAARFVDDELIVEETRGDAEMDGLLEVLEVARGEITEG